MATPDKKKQEFIFNTSNYRWMIASILVVALGFGLMIGTTDIYDFRKTVLAPIVVLTGFGIGVYAILKKK